MISSTPWRGPEGRRTLRKGFTLVEVMISSTIAAFILAGILSSFLFMGRSGANVSNYNDMETQARNALEQFAQDVRQASAITWNSSTDVTLQVESTFVRYYLSSTKPSTGNYTSRFLYRITGNSAPSLPTNPSRTNLLVSGIIEFEFKPYNITGTELTFANLASTSSATKQLQVSLRASRKSQTVVAATNTVLSARFILRNKRVTA